MLVGTKTKTLGHRSSNELYIAYTGGDVYLNDWIQRNPTPWDRSMATPTGAKSANHHRNQPNPFTTADPSVSTTFPHAAPPQPSLLLLSSTTTSLTNRPVVHQRLDVGNSNHEYSKHPQGDAVLDWSTTNTTNQKTSGDSVTSSLQWNDKSDFHCNNNNTTQSKEELYDTVRPSDAREIILLPDSDDEN